jgi:hypothetical protein
MFKATRKHVLLLLIFTFAFIYRVLLMLWQTFPPGADIGLHNSVIYSITQSGNTNFLWDYYQMGGGLSLTFPGYHIFASGIITVTGMPDYLVQSVIVALFSSLIVLCAFLITRTVWTESAAFIVAFLVAISRFDIEMLMWGGYPNVITLLLIPLTFYLYLQRDRFSLTPFLVSTSILVSSIFLTHSLSAAVFVSITVATVLFVIVSPKTFGASRKHVLYWLLPIFLGAVLVSPFLASAVPAYLGANSTFTGAADIRAALLSTRVLPLEIVLPLFGCLVLFFLLSKKYKGRFFSLPAFLLVMWLLVPLLLTQGFLFGLYVDYNRFLYFTILPVMILIGMVIDHGSEFFARVIDTYHVLTSQLQKTKKTANKLVARLSTRISRKAIYSVFVLGFLLFSFFVIPIFMTPWQGVTVQSFYQVMNNPGYEAIEWAKQNTPPGSVFVSDALYGWWFGGFAQRPTLSAVDPQYLTVARELAPAKNASYILDTDYMIDNGYIQVREDGGYIGRHNPTFLADLNWTYFPYPFFEFNDSKIILLSEKGTTLQSNDITEIPVTNQQLINSPDGNTSTIIIDKANSDFKYSEVLTVTKGLQFANMTITLQSNSENSSLDWIYFTINSQGTFYQPPMQNTVAMLDNGMKEYGQLIFAQNQPQNISASLSSTYPCITQLLYNLQGKSTAEIQILVGLYPVSDSDIANVDQTLITHEQDALTSQPHVLPMTTFDYQKALADWSVSYVANRDFELNPKFADDPRFSLVFINTEVAIFKVKANVNIAGS